MRTIDADALKYALNGITLDKHNMIWITGLRKAIEYVDKAPTVSEFSDAELFLIEMALDEVLYKLEVGSPMYKRFSLMNLKVYGLRKSAEKEK